MNVAQLIQTRQNKFIESRTIIEAEVNKFFESLQGLDTDIKTQIGFTDGHNAKNTLPSLWEEPFDITKYETERAAFDTYVQQVHAVCDKLNAEALACIQS